MLRINGKKGAKILSIWLFFILVIVGGAVVFSTSVLYSAEVDLRNAEAEMLNDKIIDCVVENGFLVESLFEESFDIFQKCKISENVFGENGFYFKINMDGKEEKEISKGISFETECELTEDNEIEGRYFPECVKRFKSIVYVENGETKKGVLEVLTASSQVGGKK